MWKRTVKAGGKEVENEWKRIKFIILAA